MKLNDTKFYFFKKEIIASRIFKNYVSMVGGEKRKLSENIDYICTFLTFDNKLRCKELIKNGCVFFRSEDDLPKHSQDKERLKTHQEEIVNVIDEVENGMYSLGTDFYWSH